MARAKSLSQSFVIILGVMFAAGCGLPLESAQPFQAENWTTYTSPDGRVSLEYPGNLKLTVRPRQDTADPQLALFMESEDLSFGLTLVERVSDEPLPDYDQSMLESYLDGNTFPTSKRETIEQNGATGLRQHFKSGSGPLADTVVAVALQNQPVYVTLSCSYRRRRAEELRPVCQRIVESLAISPAGSDLAVQTEGE